MAVDHGMNTASVIALSTAATTFAADLERISGELNAGINGTAWGTWLGPDATRFRDQWRRSDYPFLRRTVDSLRSVHDQLSLNVNEQEQASQADGNSSYFLLSSTFLRPGAIKFGNFGSLPFLAFPKNRDFERRELTTPVVVSGRGRSTSEVSGINRVKGHGSSSQRYRYLKSESTDLRNRHGSRTGTTSDQRQRNGSEYRYREHLNVDSKVSLAESTREGFLGAQTHTSGQRIVHGAALSGAFGASAGARATANGSVSFEDGQLQAKAGTGASFGIEGIATGSAAIGALTATGNARAFLGAESSASSTVGVGKHGVEASLKASAFVGGSVDVDASATLAGVTAKAGVGVSYGIGGHAEADVKVSLNQVKAKIDVGATLGLGVNVKFDVEIKPIESIKAVGRWLKH